MSACSACGADLPVDARFCPVCAAAVEPGRAPGERKLATVIFADLVGSTALAGSQDPERTRALLERFYDAMAHEIRDAGGTVEKFAGDAVMAAFGAPAALEDHAERALHVALAMQRRLDDLFEGALALRIGVNTGDVFVGAPREGSSFVSGDPVNVAARLEQGAEPGEILVGERAVAAAGAAFEFSEPREIAAKGKPEGVACRRLLRALSLMRPRGVAGLGRAFVGRGDQMATLERLFDEVERIGSPRLATILGDAGVGKTRVVREFWERLGARSLEPLRRTGRCLSYGKGVAYWPLAEVLKEHLGLLESDPPDVVLARLEPRRLLGLTFGMDVAADLHPLAVRDRFQDAWVDFLREVASARPTVVLIEDIHWAEAPLLDLLERVLLDVEAPLLLIATARPELLELRPGWGARALGDTMLLEALSAHDTVDMLDGLMDGALPLGLREMVVRRAEGNPFFVEEVVGTLLDTGLLTRADGTWSLATLPSDFSVPDTVQAVIAARIDLLERGEKLGLQAASVIGRIFWAGPVYDLVDDAEPDLAILEERDLIRRRSGSTLEGDREYAIKHALTREVAYESLPKASRARMHAAFARWLEGHVGSADEFASLMAHHLAAAVAPEDADLAWAGDEAELSELREDALDRLRRAAELSIGRMEVDDALDLLRRAIELETDPEGLGRLYRLVGRACILRYDGEGFREAMTEALALTPDGPETADLYAELAFESTIRGGMWKRRIDPAVVNGWTASALELAAPGTAARAKALITRSRRQPLGSIEIVEEACTIADELGDVELRSFGLHARIDEAMSRGAYQEAASWARRRIALVGELTDPDHVALVHGFSQAAFAAAGWLDEARACAEAQDEVTRRLSVHHRMHTAAGYLMSDQLEGKWDAVRARTSDVVDVVEANEATPCLLGSVSLLVCAIAQAYLGDVSTSRDLEERKEALGFVGFDAFLGPAELELAVARGDREAASRKLESWDPDGLDDFEGVVARLNALMLLDRWDEIEAEAPALADLGGYVEPFALRALGLARGDDELAERAVARFDQMGMDWHAAQTRGLTTER